MAGAGQDVVSYLTDPAGITANLGTKKVTDGYGGADTLAGIESIVGSDTAGDSITGTTGKDAGLYGAGGATPCSAWPATTTWTGSGDRRRQRGCRVRHVHLRGEPHFMRGRRVSDISGEADRINDGKVGGRP